MKIDEQEEVSKESSRKEGESPQACNEVLLIGKVSAPATSRELPSGDVVVEFRVVVDRNSSRGKRREVDTLDVAAWGSVVRRSALRLRSEDWIEVRGAVRRRFWQAPYGLASRWQVEAYSIKRIRERSL